MRERMVRRSFPEHANHACAVTTVCINPVSFDTYPDGEHQLTRQHLQGTDHQCQVQHEQDQLWLSHHRLNEPTDSGGPRRTSRYNHDACAQPVWQTIANRPARWPNQQGI